MVSGRKGGLMRIMRYGLAGLLCLAALWGGAHVGVLPGIAELGGRDTAVRAADHRGAAAGWRYLPILR